MLPKNDVERLVRYVIRDNWVQINKRTQMGKATFEDVMRHDQEECGELAQAIANEDIPNIREEIADRYLLLVHLAILAGSSMEEIERLAIGKAYLRFEAPQGQETQATVLSGSDK